MKVVIKLGGTLLDDTQTRSSLASQVAELSRRYSIVVVHGGGKQVTKFLELQGVQSRFVNGLRVSDEAVVDAVTKVIAGSVNKQLVSALIAAGVQAVGLSGIDGSLTTAEQLNPALGFVGRPATTNGKLLDLLAGAGYVPAVACVAGDYNGVIYNVNADQMAISCASGWGAGRLLFLTDVPGVRGNNGTVFQTLTVAESKGLIATGVAQGGMQAKLEAAEAAIGAGVEVVTIASGRESNVCQRLLNGERVGTEICRGEDLQ